MSIDHDTATLRIHEARALAEILAQTGDDAAEDHIPHMRTVAWIIAEKLGEAEGALTAL